VSEPKARVGVWTDERGACDERGGKTPTAGAPEASEHKKMSVGFIGLGSQGGPIARRIVEAGFPVTLWARRATALEPFADTGAKVASSPAELASVSDVVCVCVVGDADVEEVLTRPDGVLAGLGSGGVVVVHSTVHPDTCRRLAVSVGAQGGALVDAPVSGGGPAAAAGRLLVMAGGDPGVVEYCRPVFAAYGDPVVYLGPVGSGQVTKLLNNLLFTAHLATAVSVLELGRSLDVDPGRLAEVISHGSGESFALARIADAGGTLDRIAAYAGPLLRKDVRLVAGIAEAAGAVPGAVLTAADAALGLMNHGR
jgi:3-hydroxyisobutyrate dehydrogenase-like beta-hydroxyacid dehydrogenase